MSSEKRNQYIKWASIGLIFGMAQFILLTILAMIFYGFYHCEPKTYRRIMTWGVISTVVLILALFKDLLTISEEVSKLIDINLKELLVFDFKKFEK